MDHQQIYLLGSIGNASQQRDTPGLHHSLSHVMFSLFILVGNHFVDDHPSDSHVVLFAQHSIQFEFVKGLTEATVGTGDWVKSMVGINE